MPRLIHRAAHMAFRIFPPLKRWDYLVNGIKSRFHPVDEEIQVPLLGDGNMIINPADGVSYEIYMRGSYEHDTLQQVKKMLWPGMTFFDIGAHFGQFTIVGAAAVGDKGAVHSFEPGPIQFDFLTRNSKLNCLDNTTLNNIALGEEEGEMGFVVPSLRDLGQSHFAFRGPGTRTVKVTTLDHYCEELGIKSIDAMKVDVEGAEMQVFRGASNLLANFPPAAIFYESIDILNKNFGHSSAETHELLESYGYAVNVLNGRKFIPVPGGERDGYSDFVALRPHGSV
ncbi:MAG: FkbM family methyltransferase [Armatimonadetes bacterium]|nr:FkbM family methyltransferase [Armatimonadota bacterium]